MEDLVAFLNNIIPLTEEGIDDLSAVISRKEYAKGASLLKEESTCSWLYFMEKGLVKYSFYREDKEFIMRFFPENSLFTGLDSYIRQLPSAYVLEALEPVTVSRISHGDMELLCRKHHCLETAFSKFISIAALNMMDRVSEMLEENSAKRYANFVRSNGELMQRISLGDLASYLGITQVSLSRIRARK